MVNYHIQQTTRNEQSPCFAINQTQAVPPTDQKQYKNITNQNLIVRLDESKTRDFGI